MSNYLARVLRGRVIGTLQTQPQPDKNQVKNTAGGYAYAIDPWARVDRFLILGSEGGTYYAAEHTLTHENAKNLAERIRENGLRVVERIVEISTQGRAPKQDPAIFALAMCAGWGDEPTRALALGRGLQAVCRTGAHLLQFASYIEQFRGWGRGLRRAVAAWYDAKPVDALAYQVLKYQNRHGWTHRDLLRVAHPHTIEDARNTVYRWIAQKGDGEEVRLVSAFEQAKRLVDVDAGTMAAFVREHELPREAIPSEWLREPAVWEALLQHMPMTALLRNLATMSRVGLLTPASAATRLVTERLSDAERIVKARIHPVNVLTALMTYSSGSGVRGDGKWAPVASIVDALDAAFYLAFGNVQPRSAPMLIGLDVSGSMSTGCVAGVPGLTPRMASAALALVHARIEAQCEVMAFSGRFVPLNLRKDETLKQLVERTQSLPFERTDCSLPMLYALEQRLAVETFVVLTDNETWAGAIHPDEALRRYREWSGITAKLAVVGMTATNFSIADPDDAGMLDVVGFDTATPNLIADFVRG
jgi:60 kDa SS-A/Ro ribonucleoprotein